MPSTPKACGALTRRELEVLLLIAEERKNKEIANLLDISLKTVEFHKTQIYKKLGVAGSIGAVRFAIRQGLLPA